MQTRERVRLTWGCPAAAAVWEGPPVVEDGCQGATIRGVTPCHVPAVLIRAGTANGLHFSPRVLAGAAAAFEGAPCFVDHAGPADWQRPGGRSVRDLAGRVRQVAWDEARQGLTAVVELARQAAWVRGAVADFGGEGFFGLSADLWLRREGKEVQGIERVHSVDVVVHPAAGGRFLAAERATQDGAETLHGRDSMNEGMATAPQTAEQVGTEAAQAGTDDLSSQVAAMRAELLEIKLARAGLPAPLADAVRAQFQTGALGSDGIDALIGRYRESWARTVAPHAIRGLGEVTALRTPTERITLAFERLMGLPETAEHRSAPRLTGIREMYDLLTGDWERQGIYHGERVNLANATTTTMASVVSNTLNKVLLRAYEARPPWWKPLVYEEDLPTMNPARWISVGGFGGLDTVAEGDAYLERTWDDHTETAPFTKRGNYIGVTLEMIDRDDVQAVRSIPRRLASAALRTLSADVAALFTANGGTGPVLADTQPLFSAAHNNLGAAALGAATWDATIQAMFTQPELHSNRRLGIRPKFLLAPIELENTALTIMTSDGLPGSPNNDANVRRYSAQVVTVPEWTDANDWAACADPAELEGVCIGYRFGRAPEVFVADAELAGSLFSNDELRVKVRFVYALGVGDYRALYKANVL
ncbi:MAG: phage major capsid protein [Anaerolineae bacterium]